MEGEGRLAPAFPIRRKVPELEFKISENYSYLVNKLRNTVKGLSLQWKTQ